MQNILKSAVVLCNQEGEILDVCDYGLLGSNMNFVGAHFPSLFSSSCLQQALNITVDLPQCNILPPQLLQLSTVVTGAQVMVSGFYNNDQATLLLYEIASLNAVESRSKEDSFFKDISKLNSELTDAKRLMVKQNIQLQQLNDMKDRMVSTVAHDLNNPLTAIMGNLYLLGKSYQEDGREKRLLGNINKSIDYMRVIISDFLDLSRINQGRLKVQLKESNLVNVLKQMIEMNQHVASAKNMELSFEQVGEIPPVKLDANKISQVVNNLIGNAIKFSDPYAKIRVVVCLDDDSVRVEIVDEGQGIPASECSKLFLPFSKTSVTSTAGEKGSGLGLSISKEIVLAHGGYIDVESEVGKGSTFWFSLPIKDTKRIFS